MNQDNPNKPLGSLSEMDPQALADGAIEEWIEQAFLVKADGPPGQATIWAGAALHMILSELAKAYPAVTRANPDGSCWDGLALPARVLEFSKRSQPGGLDFARGNLLDIACEHGASDDAIKMLLASGFDPTRFSRRANMTPIGKCAFEGNANALRLFAQAGFDLTLRMEPHHTSSREMVGGTILHRLVPLRGIDGDDGLEVVQALLEGGVDPRIKDGEGRMAVEMAHGNIRLALERWLARQQQKEMDDAVGRPLDAPAKPGPRI